MDKVNGAAKLRSESAGFGHPLVESVIEIMSENGTVFGRS